MSYPNRFPCALARLLCLPFAGLARFLPPFLRFDAADRRAEVRALLPLALPLIATQLAGMAMNVVDVILAGHLGPAVLAPVAIGAGVWGLAYIAISGLMSALPAAVAHLVGAKRLEEVWPLFRQAAVMGIVFGASLSVVLWFGGTVVINAFGVTPDLARDAGYFLHAIAAGAPALGLYFVCRGLSEGLSMPRPSLAFGLLGPILLAPVGYTLMYGAGPIPAMGVVGCGLATAIVEWCIGLGFAWYIVSNRRYAFVRDVAVTRAGTVVAAGPFADVNTVGKQQSGDGPLSDVSHHATIPANAPSRIETATWRDLIRNGLPSSVTWLMEGSLFIATALVIGRLGDTAVSMHQIALNVASLTFMIPLGMAMAVSVRVAGARGRGDAEGARIAGQVGIALALRVQLVPILMMLLLPVPIIGLYTGDATVAAGAVVLLRLAGLFQLSDALQVTANGALRGYKDTRMPMIVTLFAYWCVGMPVGIWLCLDMDWGPAGMWCGLVAGLSVAAVLLTRRFIRTSRADVRAMAANPDVASSRDHRVLT